MTTSDSPLSESGMSRSAMSQSDGSTTIRADRARYPTPARPPRPVGRRQRRSGRPDPVPPDPPGRPYADLVRAIRDGELESWPELIARLRPTVERVLACYRVDQQMRLDAAGDTWEVVLTSLGDVRHPERLEGWVATVARNRMNLLLRRSRRDCPTGDVERVRAAVASSPSAVDPVEREEIRRLLSRAVSRLSDREQAVVRCRAYTDQPETLRSMELRLGIPPGSVGPTLGRGMAKLRRDREVRCYLDLGPSSLAG